MPSTLLAEDLRRCAMDSTNLTVEQKIGQMLCFGWAGENEEESRSYSAHARELIEDMQVGGVILMGRNLAPPYLATAELLNTMQSTSHLPLLIGVDQEGGAVARFKEPFTVFPGNMALGATRRSEYAKLAGRIAAEELTAFGVNWNFAPSVDVNNNPANPIIGTRSYGELPEVVASFGEAAISGMQDAGLIACAKHFPGHGDTSVDSHLGLSSIPHRRERLEEVELLPFRQAIDAGVSSIMSAHILFSAIDSKRPATLSKQIISGLLREEMGFGGVVVTDCMEMKAIADNFGAGEAAVMAVEAGVDVVLACHTLSTQREMRQALIDAVQNNRIPESRIDESVERVLNLKRAYRLEDRRATDLEKVSQALGKQENKRLSQEIADSAVTLASNKGRLLPLQISDNCKLVVTGLHPAVELLAREIRPYHDNTQSVVATNENWQQAADSLAQTAAVVVVVTCSKEPWTKDVFEPAQTDLVKHIQAIGKPVAVVAVREPYDLKKHVEMVTCVATYGYTRPQMIAAAKMLFGIIEPKGTAPESLHS